jgi:hypothetical protein
MAGSEIYEYATDNFTHYTGLRDFDQPMRCNKGCQTKGTKETNKMHSRHENVKLAALVSV